MSRRRSSSVRGKGISIGGRSRRRGISPIKRALFIGIPMVLIGAVILIYFLVSNRTKVPTPEELLQSYFTNISEKNYGEFYDHLAPTGKERITQEDFVTKHESIYGGIEADHIQLEIIGTGEQSGGSTLIYTISMDTVAGEIHYQNVAVFWENPETKEFLMDWSPAMIFPDMTWEDRIRVATLSAQRGEIFDRSGALLAGKGVASSVGFVPGKFSENKEAYIAQIAEILGISAESINNKLNASWVRDDLFVPVQTVPKDAMDLKAQLLAVEGTGIGINDVEVRVYPLGAKASLLTGYIQGITAEELEKEENQGKGYTANSQIGKSGLELIYEEQLRPKDGKEILLQDRDGNTKESLARKEKVDGDNLQLTINANTQIELYDQFSGDKSASVAIDPKTGEVLALVSTPSYDANDFIMGMSTEKWNSLNEDPDLPLLNRFRSALVPGSTMKSITAAIGLDTGSITPSTDLGVSGTSWQADANWGSYHVTTLAQYSGPANVENALTYSDNIFFAKLALEIGQTEFATELEKIGFGGSIPFEYGLTTSTFSSNGEFDSEIQLADSGYGQGQMLVNPVHLAVLYGSFLNGGDILQPQLIQTDFARKVWISGGFTSETASTVKNDLIQVVEQGTGSEAAIPGLSLAGKTGTAEIKQSQADESGTELGWFVLFNADENTPHPLLVVSMVEDVKDRGGSHYVVPKVKTLFEESVMVFTGE